MNARTLQDGGLETTLANQELMVANSRAEQLKCCSMSALGLDLERRPGRSSSAKIAETGQTGTQAPQSMHSMGSM